MKAGLVLIGYYYARRPVGTALGLLLAILMAATAVFMGMLWPAFRYHLTASASTAQWDVHINGPLAKRDADAVVRTAAAGGGRRIAFANRGAIRTLRSRRRLLRNAGDLYALTSRGDADQALAWAPNALVLKGSMNGRRAAGVDWVTARRLRVGIGDQVALTQVYAEPSGWPRRQVATVTVSAILATTTDLRGVVTRSPDGLQRVLEQTVGIVATDAFVTTDDPVGLVRQLRTLPGSENWTVVTRAAWQRQSAAAAENAGARTYGLFGVVAATAVLFVVVLQDLLVRTTRRRSSLAILYSLGARPAGLIALHLAEQLVVVAGVSSLGYTLGTSLLVDQVGLCPPPQAGVTLLGVWLGCVFALAATCGLLIHGRLADRSLIATASEWRG
jgi:hypothetical protein